MNVLIYFFVLLIVTFPLIYYFVSVFLEDLRDSLESD